MGTMDIEFKNYEENKDKNRKEIEFTLSFEGAIPSRKDIANDISACYGAVPELVFLDKLRTVRGKKMAHGRARIYQDLQTLKRYER